MHSLKFSSDALIDMNELSDTITYTYGMPKTAEKYMRGLYDEIDRIKKNPTLNTIRTNASLLQYGYNVRRANYKKMAIIYTINGDTVYIHRVIAGSMITGL